MSHFEAVRCDNCGKEQPMAWAYKLDNVLPVNWMTISYAIPASNPTGGLVDYHKRDFCSRECRSAWEAVNWPQKVNENAE